MDTIINFNNWLIKNGYSINEKSFDDNFFEELETVHKFKLGGRNELDKYMKILITKYNLSKEDEKILEFKDIVKEFKKQKKIETKSIEKNEKKMIKKAENTERVIEVDETLNTDKLQYVEKIENALKEMCIDLMGNPINGKEWRVKIMKNIYKLEIDENTKIDESEKINIIIYGKKTVKRDIKLINDYFTKKRKVTKKNTTDEKMKRKKQSKSEEKVNNKEKKVNNKEIEDKVEDEKEDIEENENDKKALYKELFGEDSDEEEELDTEYNIDEKIDNLIVDLEEIEFNDEANGKI